MAERRGGETGRLGAVGAPRPAWRPPVEGRRDGGRAPRFWWGRHRGAGCPDAADGQTALGRVDATPVHLDGEVLLEKDDRMGDAAVGGARGVLPAAGAAGSGCDS